MPPWIMCELAAEALGTMRPVSGALTAEVALAVTAAALAAD